MRIHQNSRVPLSAISSVRLIASCITQLKAQEPSRTCDEGHEEKEKKQLEKGYRGVVSIISGVRSSNASRFHQQREGGIAHSSALSAS